MSLAAGWACVMRVRSRWPSALIRLQRWYYDSLIEKAAALVESLANNHPLWMETTRMAVAITDTFLRLNSYFIDYEAVKPTSFSCGCSR